MLASLAFLIRKNAGSFELMIGDGKNHAGDFQIHSLLRFGQILR